MAIIDEIDTNSGVLRERKLTTQGVTIIRGGQTINDSFFSATLSCYSNIVYHPIAMYALAFAVMFVLSEHHGTDGPLEVIKAKVEEFSENKNEPDALRKIAQYALIILKHLITYKDKYAILIFLSIAPIAKPSKRNIIFAVMISVTVVLGSFSLLEMFILSQLFYLHVMYRNPTYKLVAVLAMVSLFFLDNFFTPTPPSPPAPPNNPPSQSPVTKVRDTLSG
uniref:Uncharacterized protein n=1 Tax=Culex pseudovishnui negev-like virus TaxID=2682815 RepID=A0A6F8PYP3_9VIRU|nr:hypothetical protein 3 [Culex pseudovishnui negev-like virus]